MRKKKSLVYLERDLQTFQAVWHFMGINYRMSALNIPAQLSSKNNNLPFHLLEEEVIYY